MTKSWMLAAATIALAQFAAGAPIVRSAVTTGGAGDAAFNLVIDSFRADLGGALNPPGACAPGPCLGGRREINWDAVPAGASSPNSFPGNFFAGTAGVQPAGRQRGAAFTTPGTDFRVSASDFSDETAFGPAEFDAFSPARIFGILGSNLMDVTFSQPGAPLIPGTVNGFGVIFLDVDYTGPASLEFFDAGGTSLGLFLVPGVFPTPTGQNSLGSFSFLGVSFTGGERVGRVRITSGSAGLDHNFTGLEDAVAMDDFIYGEPIAQGEIPEPTTAVLSGVGLALLWASRRRR